MYNIELNLRDLILNPNIQYELNCYLKNFIICIKNNMKHKIKCERN